MKNKAIMNLSKLIGGNRKAVRFCAAISMLVFIVNIFRDKKYY